MSTGKPRKNSFWTWQRIVLAVGLLLVVVGIFITPAFWYRAYLFLEKEKRQRQSQNRSANTLQPVTTPTV